MVRYDASWTGALRIVGELELPDHYYLSAADRCYFMGDYTSGGTYRHSSTNQVISNLKKPPSTRNTFQWPHKQTAIREVAGAFRANLDPTRIGQITFVPIPPSKPRDHAEYDDRMTQVARHIAPNVDVRELIVTVGAREARHSGDHRRDMDELRGTLDLDLALLDPPPAEIMLLDDVLTTGCSFKVCQAILAERFPGVPTSGLFVARRAIPRPDFAELFGDLDL